MIHSAGLSVLLASLALGEAGPNIELPASEFFIAGKMYGEAGKALQRARDVPDNDHPTLVHILALTGVVAASTGDRPKALIAFEQLLAIEPSFQVDPKWSAAVAAAFTDAKVWSEEHGKLECTTLAPKAEHDQVRELEFRLANDPFRLAKQLRIHLQGEEAARTVPIQADSGLAHLAVTPAPEVRWWAELLDQKRGVLVLLGSAERPNLATPPPAVVAAAGPARPPATRTTTAFAAQPPPTTAASSGSSQEAPLRIPAYSLMAGGVVGLAVGIGFGVQSGSLDNQLKGAARNGSGQVTGMTQKQAYSLDSQAATDSTVANVFIGVGAVAAAAGVGLWIYGAMAPGSGGGEGSVSLHLAPSPNGLVLAGVMP